MGEKLILPDGTKNEITDLIEDGLGELLVAYQLAQDCGSPPIEFAVVIAKLHKLRISDSYLRWLLKKRLIYHVMETSLLSSHERVFHEDCGAVFGTQSCFFLSMEGFRLVSGSSELADFDSKPRQHLNRIKPHQFESESHLLDKETAKPVWDPDRQELRFNGDLVKRYKLPSKNQIAVLNSFQEDEWPVRIDDPLPPTPGSDSRRKLNDTVKALNKNQKHNLLRFRSDGTGEGITWEEVE